MKTLRFHRLRNVFLNPYVDFPCQSHLLYFIAVNLGQGVLPTGYRRLPKSGHFGS